MASLCLTSGEKDSKSLDIAYGNQPIGLSVKRAFGDAVKYSYTPETTVFIKENEFTKISFTCKLNNLKPENKDKGKDVVLFNGEITLGQSNDFEAQCVTSETEGGVELLFRKAQLSASGNYTYDVYHTNGTVWLTRTVTIKVLGKFCDRHSLFGDFICKV